jgi:hypothetical protein
MDENVANVAIRDPSGGERRDHGGASRQLDGASGHRAEVKRLRAELAMTARSRRPSLRQGLAENFFGPTEGPLQRNPDMTSTAATRSDPLVSCMESVEIAGTSLVVSRIGLGTWAIGGWMWGGTDEAQSIRTIHEALDRGITLFDTAPVYGSSPIMAWK